MKQYSIIIYENESVVYENPGKAAYTRREVDGDDVTHIVKNSDTVDIKFDSGLIESIPLNRVFSLKRVKND